MLSLINRETWVTPPKCSFVPALINLDVILLGAETLIKFVKRPLRAEASEENDPVITTTVQNEATRVIRLLNRLSDGPAGNRASDWRWNDGRGTEETAEML